MKTIIKTLMTVFVVLFCVSVFYLYLEDGKMRAEETIPQKPDFEHTNNQQFLDNVLQCAIVPTTNPFCGALETIASIAEGSILLEEPSQFFIQVCFLFVWPVRSATSKTRHRRQ